MSTDWDDLLKRFDDDPERLASMDPSDLAREILEAEGLAEGAPVDPASSHDGDDLAPFLEAHERPPELSHLAWDAARDVLIVESVADIQSIVAYARNAPDRPAVRTVGSLHSVKGAVFGQRSADIKVLLGRGLRTIEVLSRDAAGAVVRVGAGCYLGFGARHDKSSKYGATKDEPTLSAFLERLGYALPIVGGIVHQSVGGFLQTGSAGGSLKYGIAEAVEEIGLVSGEGKHLVFKRGSDELNAAAVSMGLFGVLTHVTFRVAPIYQCEGVEENLPVADSYLGPKRPGGYERRLADAMKEHDYLHLNWFPQRGVEKAMQWTAERVPSGGKVVPFEHLLSQLKVASAAAAGLLASDVLLRRYPSSDPRAVWARRAVALILTLFVPHGSPQRFRDVWYKILASENEVFFDLMQVELAEVWLPVERTDEAMAALSKMFKDKPESSWNFAVEVYGAKQSPFWMSASYRGDVVRFNPYWWFKNQAGPEAHFTRFWECLLDIEGSSLHFGKWLPEPGKKYGDTTFDRAYLQKAYPKLDDWLALREKMDPDSVFLSDYWAKIFQIER